MSKQLLGLTAQAAGGHTFIAYFDRRYDHPVCPVHRRGRQSWERGGDLYIYSLLCFPAYQVFNPKYVDFQ